MKTNRFKITYFKMMTIVVFFSTSVWGSMIPGSGGGGPRLLPVLGTNSNSTTNRFTDESWTSEWIVSDITSQGPPEIGDIYTQVVHDIDSQSIVQNVWEYKPGFSIYDLPAEINFGQNKLSDLSQAGWILKEQRIIAGVTEVNVENGELISFTKNEDDFEFSTNMTWDENYSFDYEYKKNQEGNWGLNLNIEDQSSNQIVESIDLIQQEMNIGDIKDVNSLINIITYQPDENKRGEIIARIEELVEQGKGFNEDIEVAKNINDLLYDENTSVRSSAAQALRQIKDASAVPALVEALGDENSSVRSGVAWALGEIKDASAVPALIEILRDESSYVRSKAVRALGEIKDASAVPALIEALKDEDYSVRFSAAQALGKIKDASAVPALVEALEDESSYVRSKAVRALGEIEDSRVAPALIEALNDEDSDVRLEVVKIAKEIGIAAVPVLIEALRNESSYIRSNAAQALGEIKDASAVPALIEILGDENSYARFSAAQALKQIKDARAVPALIEALKDEDYSVRFSAAQALGEIKDASAVPALVEALEDENSSVSYHVVQALKKIGEQAINALKEELLSNENSSVRSGVAWALGEIKDASAVPALIEALGDEDSSVRSSAVRALGEIKDASAVPALTEALNDEDSDVRFNTVVALGQIKDISAVPALIEVLGDEDSNVRSDVVRTLKKIGEQAINALKEELLNNENSSVRSGVAWALGEIKDASAVPALIEALGDEDSSVRAGVVGALGKIGISAVPALIEALGGEDYYIKERVAEILVQIGLSKPVMKELLELFGHSFSNSQELSYPYLVTVLIESLGNSDYKESAVLILGQLGAPAVEPLIEALNDPNLRDGAKEALISIGNPSFISVIEDLLNSDNPDLENDAVDIIKGIAESKLDQESGINPDIDIISFKTMSKEELKSIASNSEYSIIRAMALYYIGSNYQDEEFLRSYIFNKDADGELSVRNESISKLEMAAILNTEIPTQAEWWDSLADRDEKTKYIRLVLKGDFTDERNYIGENRAWVCLQYAVQFVMNSRGWDSENFADQESFEKYGAGYVIPSVDYGMPVDYVTSFGIFDGHAFNAVFIGDNINDEAQQEDINNWILVEPMNDGFLPVFIGGEKVTIYLDLLFLSDGDFSDGAICIQVETPGYPYGVNN